MKYEIKGDSDCPLVHINLDKNESIYIERGCMAYMQDTEIEGKLNSRGGGLLSALGRSLTSGESIFITEAKGLSNSSIIGIAPGYPGKIVALKVSGNNQYRLNTSVFLACDFSVNYKMVSQSISKALFGGTGGFYIMETEGTGDMLVSAFGDILELEVNASKPLIVDNEHVVCWDKNLDYDIRVSSGILGFKTGEGLVNEFRGNGKVYIQTRNIHNLADSIAKFIPTN